MSTTGSIARVGHERTTPWRTFVTERPLAGALAAGFVATHIATVTGYWYSGLNFTAGKGLPNLGWPAFNGLLLLPDQSVVAQFWAGTVYHLFTGMAYSMIFAFVLFPLFKWPNTVGANIRKALVFGLALATISAGWWVPQLFPQFKPGFFSTALKLNGPAWKTVAGIYLWHVIYALNLGALYSPLPRLRD
jgi:hypothetical protein